MIRLMNESSFSEDKIRTNIDNIVKNGGDAYDAMDYLESSGFIEGISTTMKYPDGNVEITTFYNDENSNMYVAIDHTPLNKGNEVVKVWFGCNESIKRNKRMTENTDEHYTEIDELIDYVEYVCNKCGISVQNKIYDANTTFGEVSFNFYYGDRYDKSKFITHVTLTWDFEDERSKPFFLSWDGGGFTRKFDNMQGVKKYMEFIVKGF